ncbi:hypothetical protein [Actinoplanes sp. L3-i22]|uniref:hypothetical protein n=1 Tax=Actinoplanes sp. L3-i22 TaxID=2836373 RepID=UPI001C75AAF6|nr:hypothetical protein [Actinoplanes sp. L3-i22]BCY06150.1 hypothetical protein L3i22_012380 [Actinoplanes sp. L3-i22]
MLSLAQPTTAAAPWWATAVIAGCFTLLGSGATLAVTFALDWRKAARDARTAREVRAREAYLKILPWIAHVRDELRRAIEARRPFDHSIADEREQATLDALSQLDTTPEFRKLLAAWPEVFRAALATYESLAKIEEDIRATRSTEYADRDQHAFRLTAEIEVLAGLIDDLREQARKDTSRF